MRFRSRMFGVCTYMYNNCHYLCIVIAACCLHLYTSTIGPCCYLCIITEGYCLHLYVPTQGHRCFISIAFRLRVICSRHLENIIYNALQKRTLLVECYCREVCFCKWEILYIKRDINVHFYHSRFSVPNI